jgi:hypothetical protein
VAGRGELLPLQMPVLRGDDAAACVRRVFDLIRIVASLAPGLELTIARNNGEGLRAPPREETPSQATRMGS